MTARGWGFIAGAMVVALIAAAITWFVLTHERVEREMDLPQTGEVTYNDLFVLQLALERDGRRAKSHPRLPRDLAGIGATDTVLLYGDPRSLDARASERVLAWVARGGHLLVRTPPPLELVDTQTAPVLDALGVDVRLARPDCTRLLVAGEESHVEFCRGRRFDLAAQPLHAWRAEPRRVDDEDVDEDDTAASDEDHDHDGDGTQDHPAPATQRRPRWSADTRIDDAAIDDDAARTPADLGLVYARLRHGRGTVDIAADYDVLDNESIDEGPHIVLARQLLPADHGGTVHLIYAAQLPSLWMQLIRHSWMAWAPLALALFAWLWARAQRFGPLLPTPPAERRSLLEHIAASGEHTYRYGYAYLLHDAVRRAFLARLRRRDPIAAALDGEPQVAAIVERTGQPASVVRDALATPVGTDHAAFRSRIAALVRLRNLL